ncbi:MAG: PEP-CTERM sorting domain-containing protein [Planctomycetota bacterium]|jgi:hypothetical protein
MKKVAGVLMLVGAMAATANAELLSETFSGGAYDNPGWVNWHANWGNNPNVDLAGDSAAIDVGGNGSAGIAILVDISGVTGQPITLSGEWGGDASDNAWVETMFFQTNDPDMADETSANFVVFNTGNKADIAVKHDAWTLPDKVWGPETFADDAVNNGAPEFTAGLTQIATQDYVVIAFKTGNLGTIVGLDNITLVPEPSSLTLLAFCVAPFLLRRRRRG